MSSFKHKFRQVKKLPGWIYIPPAMLIRFLKFCMRTKYIDPNNILKVKPYPRVAVVWHNRLLFYPIMWPKIIRANTLAMVSPSRDGQYIVDLIAKLGVKSIRGSSNKRSSRVQYAAIKAIQDGYTVCITPDGPRGPKYKLSMGPVHLASTTGVPVLPIALNYSSYWELKSWDNFQIPKPWAKMILNIGDEIKIPPNLDDAGLEEWRQKIESALMAVTVDKPAKNS